MKNRTMMQYFEWYLPDNGLHWKRCIAQAEELKNTGINMVWLPPAYKGAAGAASVGYDVYDMYDLGEFDQKGTVRTKYGSREDYLKAVRTFQEQGIAVLCDIVLNHRMGADGSEIVLVQEGLSTNRNRDIGRKKKIRAWTKFEFPGRAGKYSTFEWNARHFSGTDWDDAKKRTGIFRFNGKSWDRKTDTENGNFDYLMGANVDTSQPEVIKETLDWGKWYQDTVCMDGLRLDAVKHIGFDFYRNWIGAMREYRKEQLALMDEKELAAVKERGGEDFFMVGEYWSGELDKLIHYLDETDYSVALFDVPLHYKFLQAATSNGHFDMSRLYEDTLSGVYPEYAVPFVDNHDTQPGQALYSFIPDWFKPIAYALILLRAVGTPCVFYGDYYGIPHDNIKVMPELKKLLKIRQCYAYGEEHLFFDDASLVGFTREGDEEHPQSGLAVLLTNSFGGKKRMYIGTQFAGQRMIDAMGKISDAVIIGADGWGEFVVQGGSVSVWVNENVAEDLYINV